MKLCIHPNCSNNLTQQKEAQRNEYPLCNYHLKEFKNNGKPGSWNCSWCTDFKQQMDLLEKDEERFDRKYEQ